MKGELIQDKYRIIRTLGKNKFSETFLAKDKSRFSLRRYVIKKFRPILGNSQAAQTKLLFQQEANILKRLDPHPQVPKLQDSFMDGEDLYLVRQWIEGITLEERIEQQGVLSEEETKQILDSILRLLKYIHSCGIVYHQLKPSNILLSQGYWLHPLKKQEHLPILFYFGEAKETERKQLKPSLVGVAIARNQDYIPQQEQGEYLYASDIYSLGLTAIYLLTGKTLNSLSFDSFGKLLWRHEVTDLKTNLARVINRAICPDPGDRFNSVEDMLQSLHAQPVLISRSIADRVPSPSLMTPEIKVTSLLFALGFAAMGITFGLSNVDFSQPFNSQFSREREQDNLTQMSERIDTMSKKLEEPVKVEPPDNLTVPAFPVGANMEQIFISLGKPSSSSKGYWGKSNAFSYFDYAPNYFALGYLSDLETQRLLQTEVTFVKSIDIMTVHKTAKRLLLDDYSPDIEHQINQIFYRSQYTQKFESDSLQGIIHRNSQDGIYIGIWDKDFH